MPGRLEVVSLESLALGRVAALVAGVAGGAARWAGDRPGTLGRPTPEVASCAAELAELLLAGTPASFHAAITRAALAALSGLLGPKPRPPARPRHSSDVESFVPLSQEERRRWWREEEALLAFPAPLLPPSLAALRLGGLGLQPGVVRAVAARLPDLPRLQTLDLGSASCRSGSRLRLRTEASPGSWASSRPPAGRRAPP
jgi:hypothetical protein